MSIYNIEMNYFNGTEYDQLKPNTVMNNISDWNDYIYSKNEVDESIETISDKINNGIIGICPWTLFKTTNLKVSNQTLVNNDETTMVGQVISDNYCGNTEDVIITISGNASIKFTYNSFIEESFQYRMYLSNESNSNGSSNYFLGVYESLGNESIIKDISIVEKPIFANFSFGEAYETNSLPGTSSIIELDKTIRISFDANILGLQNNYSQSYFDLDWNKGIYCYIANPIIPSGGTLVYSYDFNFNIYKRQSLFLL